MPAGKPNTTKLKQAFHHRRVAAGALAPPTFLALLTIITLSSCAEDKKTGKQKAVPDEEAATATARPDTEPAEDEDDNATSSFSILGQLHKDTVLKRIRLPRYDKDFTPRSLLSADTMQVINGDIIEAEHVSMELYHPDGSLKARTKMRRAIYREDDSTLEAREAIFIHGPGFKASGSGLVYDTITGRGFVLGPASTLFQIKEETPLEKPSPEVSN